MIDPTGLQVTVCVASLNTNSCTELCVRSLSERAGYPHTLRIGDSGSTDGSIEMLESMQSRGMLILEVSPSPRRHAAWLDHWRAQVDTDVLLFVDSDIEFRRSGWLAAVVGELRRSGCGIVYAEALAESEIQVEGRKAHLAPRPAPWLLAVVRDSVESVEASFEEVRTETTSAPSGLLVEDVGAAFYAEALRRQTAVSCLPRAFRRTYHHYGGLSWIPSGGSRGRKKDRDERVVARRLRLLRVAQESPSGPRRIAARIRLAPSIESAREFAFRVIGRVGRTIPRNPRRS